jgi:hypothetical protein
MHTITICGEMDVCLHSFSTPTLLTVDFTFTQHPLYPLRDSYRDQINMKANLHTNWRRVRLFVFDVWIAAY